MRKATTAAAAVMVMATCLASGAWAWGQHDNFTPDPITQYSYWHEPFKYGDGNAVNLDNMARFYFGENWTRGNDALGEYAEGTLQNFGQAVEQILMFIDGSDVALNALDPCQPGAKARIYITRVQDGTWENCVRYAQPSSVIENMGTFKFQSEVAWVAPLGFNPIVRHLENGKREIVAPGGKVNKGDVVSYFTNTNNLGYQPDYLAPATIEETLSLFDTCEKVEWDGADTVTGYLKNPFTTPGPRLIAIRDGENAAVGVNEKIGLGKVTLRHYGGTVRDVEGIYFRENYDKFARKVTRDSGWTILKDVHTAFKVEYGWAMLFKLGSKERLRPGTVIKAGESIVYAISNVDVPYGSLPPFDNADDPDSTGGLGLD
ncbi:MAG: hypothetical protein LBO21_08685 [Synergistaceae bacterium]|nr:hypothetical protein [Synergistaceae bacterium]